MAARKRC